MQRMKPEPGARPGRRAWGHLLGALFASGLLALVVTACGISLSAGEEETEIFRELTVEGDFRLGGALTLALEYEQPYPVNVAIKCDLLALDRAGTPTPEPTEGPEVEGTPTAAAIPRVRPTPANKVQDILEETLGPNPEGGPVGEATPVVDTLTRSFTAPDRPGRYLVRCFTPADQNNAVVEEITIPPVLAVP